MKNSLDKQYQDLLQTILDYGVEKKDRTGTGTKSIFGYTIRHNMKDGFPLLTTKKMAWKTLVTELIWFLRGDTNIKFLVDNGCHIWDGDAYKNYLKNVDLQDIESRHYEDGTLTACDKEEFIERIKTDDEFAYKWGELGPIYGKQWRKWNNGYDFTDQIQNLINDLKINPDSRRLMVNAWNVGELDSMVLPPCHYGFQVYTRELSELERVELFSKIHPGKSLSDFSPGGMEIQSIRHQRETRLNRANVPTRAISLMWNQRSVDTFLGLPFNIASYGLLLEIIAKAVNMVPDQLIGNLGDVHLYSNHVEQAKEQIGRDYSVEERLEFLSEKKPDFDPETAFGIAKHIDSFCHYIIDEHEIPRRTREPYSLPKLKHMKTEEFYKSLSESVSLFSHLDNTDFEIEGYQAHPAIKAPLSN
jgi:thymidylate synthase